MVWQLAMVRSFKGWVVWLFVCFGRRWLHGKDGCLSENVGMVENGYIVEVGRMEEFKGRKEGGSCVEW